MTEGDDKISRRYREASREQPPAHVDAAILAASRRAVGAGPRARRSSWMVPTSIAAVLVLGIGVSLRMQMEKPGIESSAPGGSAEYPVPEAAVPPAPAEAKRDAQADARRDAPKALAKSTQPAPRPAAPPAPPSTTSIATAPPPAPAPAPPVAAAPARMAEAQVAQDRAAQSPAAAAAPSPQAAAPAPEAARLQRMEPRMKLGAAREKREIASTPDPDPGRELERIVALREASRHGEADAALARFREHHPDYRIPEATWERVKPRNP